MNPTVTDTGLTKVMPADTPCYASYLLRLRWTERGGEPTCQAMLISIATREQRYFATLQEVMGYLRDQRPKETLQWPSAFVVD